MVPLEDYYQGQDRQHGMLARLRALFAAFVMMILLTFSIVGFLTGFLFIAESFDDIRQTGVDAWNSDVTDWNSKSRSAFSELEFNLGEQPMPMQPSHTEKIYDTLMLYDQHPEELLRPDALFYTGEVDISDIKIDPYAGPNDLPGDLEVELRHDGKVNTLHVPVIFEETRCKYITRGKMQRQVCSQNFFALQSICTKVNEDGKPTRELDGVVGHTHDVGCTIGTEGDFNPRHSNIWSSGVYKEYKRLVDVQLPDSLTVQVRSNSDPALTASIYTNGYYDFGQSPAALFGWGVFMLVTSGSILFVATCMCMLNYIWPTAPSHSERLKYFYRRYLKRRHIAFKNWWRVNVGGGETEAMPQVGQEVLLNESSWSGPTQGGQQLGAAPGGVVPPPLIQSV